MGLELPYVPTSDKKVRIITKLAATGSGQTAVDLGAGDGRVVVALAKTGAVAVGLEIDPSRTQAGKKNIKKEGVENTAVIFNADFWHMDLGDFDVVTVYGITGIMERLERKLEKELKIGARIVSNNFPFPNWQPEMIENDVYLYIKK